MAADTEPLKVRARAAPSPDAAFAPTIANLEEITMSVSNQLRRRSVVPGGGEDDAPSTCELCRYWEAFDDDLKHFQYGTCRRHAPSAVTIAKAAGYEARWPTTEASDWCGEYRPHSPQLTSR